MFTKLIKSIFAKTKNRKYKYEFENKLSENEKS